MRPYLEQHENVRVAEMYGLRPDARPKILGGTFPIVRKADVTRRLERWSDGTGCLHFTLSAPSGVTLANEEWCDFAERTLKAHGLPPMAVPWFAVRHRNTKCDHIHIYAVPRTFAGISIALTNRQARTDALHREFAAELDLPVVA